MENLCGKCQHFEFGDGQPKEESYSSGFCYVINRDVFVGTDPVNVGCASFELKEPSNG